MNERKYSIEEIDRMRSAIKFSYSGEGQYIASERSAEIEQKLRTYMQNGTSPEELETVAAEYISLKSALYRERMAGMVALPEPPKT